MLRVQAILRRGAPAPGQGPVSYGGGTLVIDEPRRQVTVRGTLVDLTPTEWGILVALASVPGRVYSRLELINRVRGYEFEGYERTVDSHVRNLRRKIEEGPASPQLVQTVLGGGYRLGLARDGYAIPASHPGKPEPEGAPMTPPLLQPPLDGRRRGPGKSAHPGWLGVLLGAQLARRCPRGKVS